VDSVDVLEKGEKIKKGILIIPKTFEMIRTVTEL